MFISTRLKGIVTNIADYGCFVEIEGPDTETILDVQAAIGLAEFPHVAESYAALLSQGCNFGFARMAQMADLTANRLAWCTAWHLREDTLQDATTVMVNFHHGLPLAQHWGGGTLSSSDGQRFPVRGKVRNAVALRQFRPVPIAYPVISREVG